MTPYDAPSGSVWEFEGELFVMLEKQINFLSNLLNERRAPSRRSSPFLYRRYVSLDDGRLMWLGHGSRRDHNSKELT